MKGYFIGLSTSVIMLLAGILGVIIALVAGKKHYGAYLKILSEGLAKGL